MIDVTQNDAVIERIQQIIDNDVRPYIEMDGGTIEFIRYEENVVYVRLAGACGTCPSSTLTLKGGVERAIRRRIPEVRAVEMDGLAPLDTSESDRVMIQI
jgi:Fe-S cluster biogenesis protein NfuA